MNVVPLLKLARPPCCGRAGRFHFGCRLGLWFQVVFLQLLVQCIAVDA